MIYSLKSRCPECHAQGFHLAHCSAHFDNRGQRPTPPNTPQHTLASQLDELLNTVGHAEANWRFDDRLDLVARREGWAPC